MFMWAWWRKEKVRGLLAASIYEPLSPEEAAALERALARDPALRAEKAALTAVKKAIPREEIEFHGDLLPILRQRMLELPARRRVFYYRPWLAAGAVTVLVVTAAGGLIWRNIPVAVTPGAPVAVSPAVHPSMIARSLADACRLLDENDVVAAQQALSESIAAYPEDSLAGQAQTMLADVEFSQLQRYPESLAAYEHLRSRYPQAFMDSPQSIERYNLLTETKNESFAPLYALDAAKRSRNAFEQCEHLVAQYPASGVASLAMNEMLQMAGVSSNGNPKNEAASLERVRNRCSDPTAIAQLNLALGNTYRDRVGDVDRARRCYTDAAAGPHVAVADSARAALARLEVTRP